MSGFDDQIAALGSGQSFAVLLAVAALLGLRHATDPDHLTALSTLVAGDGPRSGVRHARQLGLAWGSGHALALFVFGVPIVFFEAYLPAGAGVAAESAVGLLIVALAVRLLIRWRRGDFSSSPGHVHKPRRSPNHAFAIGLLHGIGGSAGVGVLLLAAIPNHLTATLTLAVFAGCTAISMAAASASCGWVFMRRNLSGTLTPVLGAASLAFGVWYFLGAIQAVPHGL